MHARPLPELASPQSTAFTASYDSARASLLKAARVLALLMLSALLAACPGAVRRPSPPAPTMPPPAVDMRGATVYAVDPAAAEVHILVFRGGTLARLGHNHVMSVRSLAGQVWVHPDPAKSGFELSFPVAALSVDEPEARRKLGDDFPGEISQSDRDGTRKNMLRSEALDAEHFPSVQLRSVQLSGPLRSAHIITRITIRDVSRDVAIPVMLDVTPMHVTATGQFDIKQTDFGIKPFSIGLGALEVVDQLQIRFKVSAERK